MKDIYWRAYGRTIRNPPFHTGIKSVLFVCLGNICRSPFAEHIASRFGNQCDYYSAGIYVKGPISPPNDAIIAANDFGVDLNDHTSRQINYGLMESYDLIVAMESWHFKFLRKIFPEFRERIALLPLLGKNHVASKNKYFTYNIKDPFGRGIDEFHYCYQRIYKCLEVLLSEIKTN